MARCCGGTGSCACNLQAGRNVQIEGHGSAQEPFLISSDVAFGVQDSDVFDLGVTGAGTAQDPWMLSLRFRPEALVSDLGDIILTSPNGSRWKLGITDGGVLTTVALT